MWCEQMASNHNRSTYVRLLLEWWMVKLLICNFIVKLTRIQLVFCLKKRVYCAIWVHYCKSSDCCIWPAKNRWCPGKNMFDRTTWLAPARWLMPCIVAGTTGKLNSHGFSFWLKSPSAKQHQNPCSGPPSMYQDLSMCRDWPVKKVIVNLPISMKETWNVHLVIHWVCSMKETSNVH